MGQILKEIKNISELIRQQADEKDESALNPRVLKSYKTKDRTQGFLHTGDFQKQQPYPTE